MTLLPTNLPCDTSVTVDSEKHKHESEYDNQITDEELELLGKLGDEFISRTKSGRETKEDVQNDFKLRLKDGGIEWFDVWAHASVNRYLGRDAKYRVMLDWINKWIADAERGKPFGQFKDIKRLGSGGYGVVFQATCTKRGGPVAVKLPLFEVPENLQTVRATAQHYATFFDEARKHANITVPGCVAIYEYGMPTTFGVDEILLYLRDSPIWFSMQLIVGISLDKVLHSAESDYRPGDTIPYDQVVELMAMTAERLHDLHSTPNPNGKGNLIHQDVKPANILLDQKNNPWLTDFGLAMPLEKTGVVRSSGIGTDGYMSPEQINAGDIDCRSDIFSLGVVLYQLLCGRLPFGKDEILSDSRPKPLRKERPSITPELEQICLKALEKKPNDRYQTAQALASDLRNSSWYHQGLVQLINVGRIADAVDFLSFVDRTERKSQAIAVGQTQSELGMILAAIFEAEKKQGDRKKRRGDGDVDAKKLWKLLSTSYATNDLERLIGWMGQTLTKTKWDELIRLFLQTNDYVVRYAAGCGQAVRFQKLIETNDPQQIDQAKEELDLLFSGSGDQLEKRSADRQEVASYAIAGIGETPSVRKTVSDWFETHIDQMSKCDFYFARSALGGMLIEWSLNGQRKEIERLVIRRKLEGFWKPIWDYLKIDVVTVAAENPSLSSPAVTKMYADLAKEIAAHKRFIADLKQQRRKLLKRFGAVAPLAGLIETHLEGEGINSENPDVWKELQSLFIKSNPEIGESGEQLQKATSLFRFLFSHPVWSKAEDTAAILARLAAQSQYRKAVFNIVDTLLANKKENWRVHYGAIEATFLLRHVDSKRFQKDAFHEIVWSPDLEFGRFEKRICDNYDHDACLIRGNCSENFVADLFNRDPLEWIGRLNHFSRQIARWLEDDDCWVLEHMFRLFRTLQQQQKKSKNVALRKWMQDMLNEVHQKTDSLLSRIGPEWPTLSREEFLLRLERCRKQQLAARSKWTGP